MYEISYVLKVQTTYSPYDEFIKDMSNKSYSKIKTCTKCHPYAEIINDMPYYLIILYNILLHQTRDGNGHCPLQVANTKPALAPTQNLNY